MFREFIFFCHRPSEFEKSIFLISQSLDICSKAVLSTESSSVNPVSKTGISAFAFEVEEIQASSEFVESITASSSSSSISSVLSSDWNSSWTSEGPQGSHWICVHLKDGILAKDVGICVQSEDNSWCPKVITVRAAQTMESLRAKPKVLLDYSSQVARGGRHFLKALDDSSGIQRFLIS
jgi:hypothetical protein